MNGAKGTSETAPELNFADLATEADIRVAMADDRYWEAGNPDRESYVQQVSDAWQRLQEVAQAANDAAPPRRGAEPVGSPGPDMPLGRPTVIFVGGAMDGANQNVLRPSAEFRAANPGIDTYYFPHDDAEGLRLLIDSLPAGTYTSLVGHSWGGDTAAAVAAVLGRDGRQIDNLVTIDPVRREADAPDTNLYSAIRAGAADWTNVNATGGGRWDRSNIIAGLGRDYGAGLESYAHRFIDAPVSHRQFGVMLDARGADGLSAMDRITRVW